jgi:hypothetical protein
MEKFARTSHYISELLFVHDCVIVPSFGGFVCSYAPAKVHPAQHVFTPPSKQVFFNKHLQNNDGLLVNAIAAAVPCSFEEALKDVRAFVAAIQQEVGQGRKVELPHLGTLSVDPEGNISFESTPDVNFLIESFGLSSFQSMPILREGVVAAEQVEKTEKKEAVIIALTQEPAKEKEKEPVVITPGFRVWRAAAFIALPLLAASLFMTLNDNFRGAALAGLGISSGEPTLYTPKTYFTKENTPVIEEVKPDANGTYTLTLDESSPGMVVSIYKVAADSLAVKDQTRPDVPVVTAVDNAKYYVIGGAFGVPENAENYRQALIAKGYKPVMLDNVRSKLTHISLKSFNSKGEAEAFLTLIKSDLPDAWILKQK